MVGWLERLFFFQERDVHCCRLLLKFSRSLESQASEQAPIMKKLRRSQAGFPLLPCILNVEAADALGLHAMGKSAVDWQVIGIPEIASVQTPRKMRVARIG